MAGNAAGEHSLQDHLSGADSSHQHPGGEFDHDHDDLAADGSDGDALRARDHVELVSVGIDIGSSGTQLIFSRIGMQRMSEELSSRYFAVTRETIYQSPVSLTPYQDEQRIDEAAIGEIIDRAYAAAGIHPDRIDTGAVILTGEAVRRGNARAIADVIAEMGGEFVCAAAGHHMESLLAAYGSGAARASHDLKAPVLNVDIGGGTTKLALVENGTVVHTAAIHLGGRLAVLEGERVARLDPAGKRLAAHAGIEWSLGVHATAAQAQTVAEWMADALVCALTQESPHADVSSLWLTDPLEPVEGIAGVMFSGGVAEYVYGREERDFGDLGKLLGHALRRRMEAGALPYPLLPAGECIRATAIGASEYSVQLSGNTVYISDPGVLLPRKNLQVLRPDACLAGDIDAARVTQAIQRHFKAFDLVEGGVEVALAFRWEGAPSYARLAALARGIVEGLPMTLLEARPVFLVIDGDIAHSLGALLREEWKVASEVLVIDGVSLRDFDYIDLGRVRMPSHTVPVTIKSLVFTQDPRAPRSRHHGHVHGPGTHSHR
ncbi:MAG: ethanolamine ammonia-lyase reactivating factor EutA [Usitatibacter sp.]